MTSRLAEPVRGARALFVFHLTLLSWWAFVQVYYRVAPHFVKADPSFAVDAINFGFTVVALPVTAQFARGRNGSASQTAARIAAALALVDLIVDTLQFMPQLGLPALMPSDKGMTELFVRGVWVSCEFAMRGAMFVALWRAQAGADKRLALAFFGLVGLNFSLTALSFARSIGPYTAFWQSVPFSAPLARFSLPMGMLWLALLVYLNRRVASGLPPVTSPALS